MATIDERNAQASLSGRTRAMEILCDQIRRFPDLSLDDPDERGLDGREAALCHAIVDQSIRRWLTLRHLLQGSLRQRFEDLEPQVAAGLLAGAAQILLLDKIPPWSASNESVRWVKAKRGKRAAGLVNAVLRRMSELVNDEVSTNLDRLDPPRDALCLADGRFRALSRNVFDHHPWKRLAQQYSIPRPIIERWRTSLGDDQARAQISHTLTRPPIVLNTEHLVEPLDDSLGVEHCQAGHRVYVGNPASLRALLNGRSDLWVQDAASGASVRIANELRPKRVLDLCAGMGTKSRQMAMTWPDAKIVATDKDPGRYRELLLTCAAYPNLSATPFGELADHGGFDLVLLDVPCTNTGVLARRREARYRFSEQSLGQLVGIQREILERGVSLASTHGYVLYSTCSNEAAEGEDQADWAVSAIGVVIEQAQRELPEGLPGGEPAGYRDGSYAVLLRRA